MNIRNDFEASFEKKEAKYENLKIHEAPNSANFQINVSESFQKKIEYLHIKFPGKEWSGFAFAKYNQVEVNSDLVVELIDFLPMNLGTSAFTSFEQTETFAGFIAENPEYMNYKLAYLHTHHSMGAFHSGTDTYTFKRLIADCKNVLFLVVDTRNTWWGHIGMLVENKYMVTKKSLNSTFYDISNKSIEKQIKGDEQTTVSEKFILSVKGNFNYSNHTTALEDSFLQCVKEMETKNEESHRVFSHNESSFMHTNYSKPLFPKTPTKNKKSSVQYIHINKKDGKSFLMSHQTAMFLKSLLTGTTKFASFKLPPLDLLHIGEDWVGYFCQDMVLGVDDLEFETHMDNLVTELLNEPASTFKLVYEDVENLLEEIREVNIQYTEQEKFFQVLDELFSYLDITESVMTKGEEDAYIFNPPF